MGSGDQVPDALAADGRGRDARRRRDARHRRPVTLRHDRRRHPRLRGAAGVRRQQPAAAAVHRARRDADRAVPAARLRHARTCRRIPRSASGNSRVTDETAPVTILAPDHPLFTFPNRITAADFDGWVQERNLYAFTDFDPRYTPLLEAADPGRAAAARAARCMRRSARDATCTRRMRGSASFPPACPARTASSPIWSASRKRQDDEACAAALHCRERGFHRDRRTERSPDARAGAARAGAAHRRPQRLPMGAPRAQCRARHRHAGHSRPAAEDPHGHSPPARRRRRRAVLVRLRAGDDAGPDRRARHARAGGRRAPDDAEVSGHVRARPDGRRRGTNLQDRPDRVADRDGGWPFDRQLACDAADVPPARRALHDADAQHEHSVGGRGYRHAEAGGPVEVRRRGRPRDESARHARGLEPHIAGNDGGRDPRLGGAGRLLALRRARPPRSRA